MAKKANQNTVVVGAQWGDEGKAKVTDLLAKEADVVIRSQGGCNAGHTVKHQGETYKFHLIPSGLLYPDKLCIIANGVVIDPGVLMTELEGLKSRGIPVKNLKISNRAHLTLPFHRLIDQSQENQKAGSQSGKIGTTGKGIGPTYMDKVGRFGLRVADLYEAPETLKAKITQLVEQKNTQLEQCYQIPPLKIEDILTWCHTAAEQLKPFVVDTVPLIHEQMAAGKSILLEGAQGTLLDVDFGTYPFVTSSNATAGGACTGSGIGPTAIDRVIGVMKAYTTRVGEGPFPTELTDSIGQHLVDVGQEFGTTTGRQRRCGWFDGVMARFSAQVNGLSGLAVTKLDVLDGLTELKVAVAYRDRVTGETIITFPAQFSQLANVDPVYETLPGWPGSVKNARRYDDLPAEAQSYLQRLAELTGTPLAMVSVGPEREETIMIENAATLASV